MARWFRFSFDAGQATRARGKMRVTTNLYLWLILAFCSIATYGTLGRDGVWPVDNYNPETQRQAKQWIYHANLNSVKTLVIGVAGDFMPGSDFFRLEDIWTISDPEKAKSFAKQVGSAKLKSIAAFTLDDPVCAILLDFRGKPICGVLVIDGVFQPVRVSRDLNGWKWKKLFASKANHLLRGDLGDWGFFVTRTYLTAIKNPKKYRPLKK